MEIELKQKIDGLKSEDKKRSLFSLADNKSKDAVVFPPSFGGKVGENVFKFKKDFNEAIIANHVRISKICFQLCERLGNVCVK